MGLTTAQLIGLPVNDFDARPENIRVGKKASGGSSAIAVGRVVFHTGSSGLWAIATSGSTGRMGVIPNLDPVNVDGDTELQVAIDGEWIVEANGAIKPGEQVLPDTGGKVKATTGAGFAFYVGHPNEGGNSVGNAPTDAAAAEAVKISIKRGYVV